MQNLVDAQKTGEVNIYKRIIYVTIYLLRCKDLDNNLYNGLDKLFNSILYHPPWDKEMPIHDDLDLLTTLCYQYRPNDSELEKVFQEDISEITIDSLLEIWTTL